jgi:hypothetical protein
VALDEQGSDATGADNALHRSAKARFVPNAITLITIRHMVCNAKA